MADKLLVEMRDGRKVGFGKVAKVNKEILVADGRPVGIRFDGRNGDTFSAMFADLPDSEWIDLAEPGSISLYAMAHGYSQKMGDEYSGADTVEDAMEAVRLLWPRLCKAKWDAETKGGAGISVLFEACKRAFADLTAEQIREILNGLSAAEKAALKAQPGVVEHVRAIEAERGKGVDTKGLMGKFAPK